MEDLTGEGASVGQVVAAFAEEALGDELLPSKNDDTAELALGPVGTQAAERVKLLTGVDIAGLPRVIRTDELIHAFRGHGEGNETRPGHVPITADDFARLPMILENFDAVQHGPRVGSTPEKLTYRKRINGYVYVVEWISRKNANISFRTMYKLGTD